MAANYFNTVRKSLTVKILFSSILSNLVVFGQPMQEMVVNYYNKKDAAIIANFGSKSSQSVDNSDTIYRSPESSFSPGSKKYVPGKSSNVFYADEMKGTIGKLFETDAENPYDNFFTVHLPENINPGDYDAVLVYELYGLADASQATKSINSHASYGGKVIATTDKWIPVEEHISATQLQQGANEIFFNRRVEKNYEYSVRNVKIELNRKDKNAVHIAGEMLTSFNGNIYLAGTVSDLNVKTVEALGVEIAVHDGVFEHVFVDTPKDTKEIKVSYKDLDSKQYTTEYPVAYKSQDVNYQFKESVLENNVKIYPVAELALHSALYDNIAVSMDKAYQNNKAGKISIEGLKFKDIKTLNHDIENVTSGNFIGYRIKKHNVLDSIPVQVRIKYDADQIPDGYTARDIKTFYFDKNQRDWKALPVDSLDLEKKEIISTVYNGETDYINGVIKVPDSPETGSFTPTTISDMKYANPAVGVVSIQPPTPNNTGTANTGFSLKMPQGRNGMQPSLNVSYNSESGNNWMGIGWNLSTQAITLNTKWGSPSFNGTYESELYSLNGADLVLKDGTNYTNPHRQSNIARSTERVFYQRKEGSYQKIIRHGSTTKNYWWEVIDKQGNKTFYGGVTASDPNAVLKDADGDIAHWAITRTQDPYGNYVEYTYTQSTTAIAGSTVMGKEFYPEKIRYTRHTSGGNNYYEVEFKRNGYTLPLNGSTAFTNRNDAIINARNGFVQLTDDLLTEVHVSLVQAGVPQRIRSYRFDYQEMALKKQQLIRISEFDTADKLFYSNTMEYYNDYTGTIISPSASSWAGGGNDGISSPLQNLSGVTAGIIPNGSPLGTSVSTGFSAGLRVGIGIGANPTSIANTVGGSFNYSQNTQDTRISFIDINGDGLPDKVFRNGSNISYRPNTGLGFGELISVVGANSLSTTKSKTTGTGFDANALGLIGAGKSWSKTKVETDDYFTDFNGDGLPDLVTGGRVRFNGNTTGNYLDRVFDLNVGYSENTIVSGAVDPAIIPFLNLETMDELREEHPQFDHVKVWQAPYTGNVSISSSAKLIAKNSTAGNTNNFRVTIERGNFNQSGNLATTVSTSSLSTVNQTVSMSPSGLQVTKGDIFFFRVHNLDYGYGGEVQWNPVITYNTATVMPLVSHNDETGKQINVYNSQSDFIINNDGGAGVENGDTSLTMNFNLTTPFTVSPPSDDVRFIIKKVRINLSTGTESTISTWTRTYLHANSTFTGNASSFSHVLSTPSGFRDVFHFYAESDSNVDWGALRWVPSYNCNVSGLHYPGVNYITFDDNVNQKGYWIYGTSLVNPTITTDGGTSFMTMSHNLLSQNYTGVLNSLQNEEFPIKINWVVKEEINNVEKVLYKRSIYIFKNVNTGAYVFAKSNNIADVINMTTDTHLFRFNITKQKIKDIYTASGKIYSAFYINNKKIGFTNPSTIKLELATGVTGYTFTPITLTSPFISIVPQFYGLSYRGWGQFLYNGGIEYQRDQEGNVVQPPVIKKFGLNPIDISLLNVESQADGIENVDPNASPDSVASEGTAIRYTFYKQENQNNKYVNEAIFTANYGINPNGLLTSTVGRFGESSLYNVYINPNTITLGGSGIFPGMKQRSESKGSAVSGNLGYVNGTDSKATSNVSNQYLDLNGDRYPDIVSSGKIQYTNMLGGLSSISNGNPDSFVSGDESTDWTAGVTIPSSKPSSTESGNGKAVGNKTNTNVSSGINTSSGKSNKSRMWLDINGDGLADKVRVNSTNIEVWLNTGYGFTDMIVWGSGYSDLVTSKRTNAGVGPSFSFGASFAAGFGASLSTANMHATLLDVNGDALPDLVTESGGTYKYYLNNGKGFDTTLNTFFNGNKIDEDSSVAGNVFGSFTGGFTIPLLFIVLKVVFSPSVGANANYSEKITSVNDINGDGFIDVLSKGNSTNNTTVTAKLNTMGKTYLLKKVNTPLGGSWTVDYARNGNVYELPQNKWVVNKIQTHDGFTTDNAYKPDATLTGVTYGNPKNDRREREFLGFGTVSIQQKDPSTQAVFRTTVKTYHNENYYLSGIEKSNALYNQSGQLLSESTTLHNLLDPDSPVVNMNATVTDNYFQNNLISSASVLLDQSRLFIAVAKITSTSYESGQSLSMVKDFISYDNYGNLLTYIDRGEDPDDAFKSVIEYYPLDAVMANTNGFPKRISVYKNSTNQLYRQRSAVYNNKGKLSQITTKLNQTENRNISFAYDNYGNTITINDLDNLNSSNAYFVNTVGYDGVLSTYPVSYSNSFGESSSTQYNYLFGVPVFTTDKNSQSMRTRIDNRGRTVEVTGPNELVLENTSGNGVAWTIRMDYKGEAAIPNNLTANAYMIPAIGQFAAVAPGAVQPTASQHHAVTRHFDPEYAALNSTISTNQLLTISIVDGFGQPLQVKKTHLSNAAKWMVSGFEKKDAYGRTLMSYLSTTQIPYPTNVNSLATSDINYYLPSSLPAPTIMTYDEKDRVKTVKKPGESQMSQVNYTIEDGMFVEKTTNELSQTSNTYTDIRGRKRKMVQNSEITTTFEYNAINELIRVVDNEGFVSSNIYDLGGRRTELQHPDRGVITYKYDKSGNLLEQSTSNLLLVGGLKIKFSYDFSRLIKVTYPQIAQNEVKYTYGSPSDPFAVAEKAIGRILYQEDASGIQVFGYGRMGEVTKNLRSVAVAGYQSYWFYSSWKYDSWNRVQEIVYPDQEKVSYSYNSAGALKAISSTIEGISNIQPVVTSIIYDDYGSRSELHHGNGTHTYYNYDLRRRMNVLSHSFTGFNIAKNYTYDVLSNITAINTGQPLSSLPAAGQIGGPVNHLYEYDDYNRLVHARGNYTGPNDHTTPYLRQDYDLLMEYNTDHTIKKKTQIQTQGITTSYGGTVNNQLPVYKNNYVVDYSDYATGAFVAGSSYGYQQPHAVRSITESPGWINGISPDDPRVKHKQVSYDANGNQTEIKEKVGELTMSLRKNLWDEDNRLMAVDLKPDDKTGHPIAIYTYNAGGERIVRYNMDRMDISSNAGEMAQNTKDNIMLYPNGLIMGKAIHNVEKGKRTDRLMYTKHYYIGSERISAKTGTVKDMGYYPSSLLSAPTHMPQLNTSVIRAASNLAVTDAGAAVTTVYNKFSMTPPALQPIIEEDIIRYTHDPSKLNIYYFHPDHLSSASYMTNAAGTVSQHMEYLPFGETLVDEHTNSFSSPFKFNGKEFDEETGNYYYGARYYDPKWSVFISVDPLAETNPEWTPYRYCFNNPINLTDPTGMLEGDYFTEEGKYLGNDGIDDKKVYVVDQGSYKANDSGGYNIANSGINELTDGAGNAVNIDTFNYLASVLYAEGSSTFDEAAGIFSVLENRAALEGTSIMEQATTEKRVDGASEKSRAKYFNPLANNSHKENANAGVIVGLSSTTDFSHGAYFWDGKDFKSGGGHDARYAFGYMFTNTAHDLYNQGDNKVPGSTQYGSWNYQYKSTHAAGNTTFTTTTWAWRDAQLQRGSVAGPMGTNFGRIIKP